MRNVRILVLGNGAAGAEKQGLSLSSRLDQHLRQCYAANVHVMAPQLIRVQMKDSFRNLPPALQIAGARLARDPFFGYAATDEQKRVLLGLDEPQPMRKRIVIGCGRTTVALNAALRQPWTGAPTDVFNIQIQHPRVPLGLYDAVITPRHDARNERSRPSNLFLTRGTICSIDETKRKREGDKLNTTLERLLERKIRLAWLIGGPCRGFSFSERDAIEMVDQILDILHRDRPNISLMVTFSRRTPQEARLAIQNRLQRDLQTEQLFVWDGHGANPYEAMLHHATGILATPDSISMTTEAIATGKPVFIVCADRIRGKFWHFHDQLFAEGFSSPLSLEATRDLTSPTTTGGQESIEAELDQLVATLSARILCE